MTRTACWKGSWNQEVILVAVSALPMLSEG